MSLSVSPPVTICLSHLLSCIVSACGSCKLVCFYVCLCASQYVSFSVCLPVFPYFPPTSISNMSVHSPMSLSLPMLLSHLLLSVISYSLMVDFLYFHYTLFLPNRSLFAFPSFATSLSSSLSNLLPPHHLLSMSLPRYSLVLPSILSFYIYCHPSPLPHALLLFCLHSPSPSITFHPVSFFSFNSISLFFH